MKRLLVFLLVLYIGALSYLFANQQAYIYFPQMTARVMVKSNYQLLNQGVELNGWVLNPGQERAIIYFGGNAESVEGNLPLFEKLFDRYSVYLLAYRGYGESEGDPSEKALCSDALALYDRIKKHHREVAVIGRSLGSGVATYLASERAVTKMALVTPFDSIEHLAADLYPVFPVRLLLQDKYDSVGRVGAITAESLVLLAEQDRVVPRAYSENLIAGFAPTKLEVRVIEGASHNSISSYESYFSALDLFFNR
ncbi:MAG: alpha/beta hydrolase [Candidatus Sedimenticola sp. (ex Thyasira tokunagai)]